MSRNRKKLKLEKKEQRLSLYRKLDATPLGVAKHIHQYCWSDVMRELVTKLASICDESQHTLHDYRPSPMTIFQGLFRLKIVHQVSLDYHERKNYVVNGFRPPIVYLGSDGLSDTVAIIVRTLFRYAINTSDGCVALTDLSKLIELERAFGCIHVDFVQFMIAQTLMRAINIRDKLAVENYAYFQGNYCPPSKEVDRVLEPINTRQFLEEQSAVKSDASWSEVTQQLLQAKRNGERKDWKREGHQEGYYVPDNRFLTFLSNPTGDNPLRVRLGAVSTHEYPLKLMAYSISGVPVTGGVPNDLYYNLNLECSSVSLALYDRNDNGRGIPLQLTGEFTCRQFEQPITIGTLKRGITDCLVSLQDQSGNPAQFSKMCLWLTS